MRITFTTPGMERAKDAEDLESLADWLARDRALRLGGVRVEPLAGPPTGTMSAHTDTVQAVCAAVSTVLLLAESVRSWYSSRRDRESAPRVIVQVYGAGSEAGQIRELLRATGCELGEPAAESAADGTTEGGTTGTGGPASADDEDAR
ncbi:effector-associated constant component EACC1 [Streptomyces physcomitrii]|uniref:Uncharacterized protein n=1 Tax=Streptomyces physcomitrii TaxID=2724184 RepID=A0ABX1HBW8_9ACTN|nr:hypothetical protein [Streptomyces physcomitrii]NKI44734.1 hypothetical protein [Streptomyces physcomitrii]